ncbi:LOW QUALITY PROTEIN: uncharacterized protein MYH16 [Phoenicopterus ruber ruber]
MSKRVSSHVVHGDLSGITPPSSSSPTLQTIMVKNVQQMDRTVDDEPAQESWEDQITQVNPVLETLDNAKTTRKNNSSHLKLLLVPNPNHYHKVAFDVLGSSPEEKICVYKLTRGIMHSGTVKFKLIFFPPIAADRVAQLMGLNSGKLQRGITRPRVKTGNKLVQKGPFSTVEQNQGFGQHVHAPQGHGWPLKAAIYNNHYVGTMTEAGIQCSDLVHEESEGVGMNAYSKPSASPSKNFHFPQTDRNVHKLPHHQYFGAMPVKPLMNVALQEKKMLKELELRSIMSKTGELTEHVKAEEQTATLSQENNLPIQLQAEQENLLDAEECLAQMMKSKMDLLSQILDMKELMSVSKQILEDLSDLKCDLEGLETTLETEKEKEALDHRVTLTSDLSAQNDSVTKFQKEKRALEEVHQAEITAPFFFTLSQTLQGEENKVNHPTKNNPKPTAQMHELEDKREQEERIHGKVEKAHHKAESDLEMTTDNLNEMKRAKLGRSCPYIEELEEDLKAEHAVRTQLNSDAHVHKLEDILSEANAQLAEVEKSQAEINAIRLQGKFLDSFVQCYLPLILLFPYISSNSGSPALQLSWEHKEAQSRLNQIVYIKSSLTSQADDLRQLDEESKSCTAAVVSLADTKRHLDLMKEPEEESKAELQCLVSKLNTEVTIWRTKYRTDAIERTKELEETKTALAVRLQEAQETAESVQARAANTEKTKQRLQKEAENLTVNLEKANAAGAALDKKQRAFDKMLAEWQQKTQELQVAVDSSQKEYTTENFELKTAYEESLEHLESMKKENKALQEEIKDLINQLGEGGKSIHELRKRRLELEKDELQVALEEAESSLEAEESKLICVQLKRAQVKVDTDRRHEKEEFETTRNNHQHATESLQASLEIEADAEALRLKKIDTDLTSTEMQLDHTNRNNSELVRTLTKLPQHFKDLRIQADDAAGQREELQEQYVPPLPAQTELEEAQTAWRAASTLTNSRSRQRSWRRHNELNVHVRRK